MNRAVEHEHNDYNVNKERERNKNKRITFGRYKIGRKKKTLKGERYRCWYKLFMQYW